MTTGRINQVVIIITTNDFSRIYIRLFYLPEPYESKVASERCGSSRFFYYEYVRRPRFQLPLYT
jgi:hypothetical protein